MKAAAPIGCRRCGSPVGYGPSVDRRGGIYPARRCLPRRGGAGRCEHRPLQGLAARQGCRFPVGYGPSVDRRGGIYPARGCLRRRGVRRDEGIPPYGRPGGFAAVRFGGWFRKVCRGGIYPARGTLRRRRVPGTISGLRAGPAARLASETRLRAQCEHRPLQRFVVTGGRSFPVGRGIRRRP